MAITAVRVTAGGTAVALNTLNTAGLTLVVTNVDATDSADLGPSGVASGGGFPLGPGETVTVHVDAGDQLFAIESAAATPADLAVLRT